MAALAHAFWWRGHTIEKLTRAIVFQEREYSELVWAYSKAREAAKKYKSLWMRNAPLTLVDYLNQASVENTTNWDEVR
ncbi:MAG: hypothetical protein L0Y60_16765 [Beijerinckiaceae bacterium]|nr:hypothetical protein [Beijerinckiaceae bacterium]